MSHEFSSGFFVGSAAWHGLGKVFTTEDAPKTCREAIKAAGCDWVVGAKSIYLGRDVGDISVDESGNLDVGESVRKFSAVEGFKAITRLDNDEVLGVVSDQYVPVQNADAFEFFDPFISSGEASFEAAGSLQGGRTVWILTKINAEPFEVGDGDKIAPYLAITMGHGGNRAVNVMFTPIRVVCMNTVRWAEQDAKDSMISIRHVGAPVQALGTVRDSVRLASRTFEVQGEKARELTKIGCDMKGLEKYVREVYELESDDKMPRAFERIEAEFEYGAGADLDTAKGTRWGAYNAVTSYLDHSRGNSDDARMRSSWFGDSRRLNARAWDVAVAAIN